MNHARPRRLKPESQPFGRRVSLLTRPLPADDPLQRCPDITKARQLLGWQPKVPQEEGLRRTIAYFARLLADPDVAVTAIPSLRRAAELAA